LGVPGCFAYPLVLNVIRFFYDLKRKPVVNGAHPGFCPLFCMDAPAEAVIAVLGNHMGVVAVVYDVAHLHLLLHTEGHLRRCFTKINPQLFLFFFTSFPFAGGLAAVVPFRSTFCHLQKAFSPIPP